MTTVKLPCSFEQGEMVADHHMYGGGVVILDAERLRLVQEMMKRHPDQRIASADLDIETCEWTIELKPR